MLEVAEIFRLHGPEYRAKFGARMLPSHRRAMQDIEQCRTAALGGQLYFCNQCQDERSITPARTATVPSAATTKPIHGWTSNRICCCPYRTSWSPSPCLR